MTDLSDILGALRLLLADTRRGLVGLRGIRADVRAIRDAVAGEEWDDDRNNPGC